MWRDVEDTLRRVDHAVRFELRPPDRRRDVYDYIQARDPSYFTTVVNNATSVFRSVFSRDEPIALLVRIWSDKRNKRIRHSAYWLQQVSMESRRSMKIRKRKGEEGEGWWREALMTGVPGDFSCRSLSHGIAHADFGNPYAIPGDFYFVSVARSVVFHMYDDRGLIVAASSPDSIPEWPPELKSIVKEEMAGWEPFWTYPIAGGLG